MPIIAPSVLAADFLNLKSEIEMVNQSHAEWIHLDVMDGVFVPNISFGVPVIKAIAKCTNKFLDVHLMIQNPERYTDTFIEIGANLVSFHVEASNHVHRTIFAIKEKGAMAGIALNPHSSVSQLENVIQDLDLVVIMSVNPGFGGQKFIENTFNKVAQLKELILKSNSNAKIEIDGGVGLHNAAKLVQAGADVLVAGSAVFKSDNPMETINQLKNG